MGHLVPPKVALAWDEVDALAHEGSARLAMPRDLPRDVPEPWAVRSSAVGEDGRRTRSPDNTSQ